MCLTPDTRDFKFLKILQVLKFFCKAQKKFFLNALKKRSVQKKFRWKFLKFSKSKQRQPSECRLCLDLRKFSIFSKKKFAQNFFQGITRRSFFGPYKKFSTLVKFFKKFNLRVSGVKRIFFSFSLGYIVFGLFFIFKQHFFQQQTNKKKSNLCQKLQIPKK